MTTAICVEKMVQENLGLARMVAHEMVKKCAIDYDDLFQIGSMSLMKSTQSYNPEYNVKFSTYATKIIRNDVINYIRKESKYFTDSSVETADEDFGYEIPDGYTNVEHSVVNKILIEQIKNILPEEEYQLLCWRNIDCLTQAEIAERIGCSQGHVYRLEQKIIKKVKEWFGSER